MSNQIDYIKLEALSMAVGENRSVHCCFCDNTPPYPPTLSITRQEGSIVYHCFRASCGGKGVIGSTAHETIKQPKPKFSPTWYDKPTRNPTRQELLSMSFKYSIGDKILERQGWKIGESYSADITWVFPLFDKNGTCYGHTTKAYGGNFKALHYITKQRPLLHYTQMRLNQDTPLALPHSTAILTEDVISAVKMGRYARGVALLGTNINEEGVRDLLSAGYNNVIIALDPDASEKAFAIKKKFGLFFRTCRVVLLPADPKDMEPIELERILGEEDT